MQQHPRPKLINYQIKYSLSAERKLYKKSQLAITWNGIAKVHEEIFVFCWHNLQNQNSSCSWWTCSIEVYVNARGKTHSRAWMRELQRGSISLTTSIMLTQMPKWKGRESWQTSNMHGKVSASLRISHLSVTHAHLIPAKRKSSTCPCPPFLPLLHAEATSAKKTQHPVGMNGSDNCVQVMWYPLSSLFFSTQTYKVPHLFNIGLILSPLP